MSKPAEDLSCAKVVHPAIGTRLQKARAGGDLAEVSGRTRRLMSMWQTAIDAAADGSEGVGMEIAPCMVCGVEDHHVATCAVCSNVSHNWCQEALTAAHTSEIQRVVDMMPLLIVPPEFAQTTCKMCRLWVSRCRA